MTGMLELHAIAQMSAVRIVDCLFGGTLIALAVGIGLRLSRRQSSGTRFAVWFSALVAIASLPFLSNLASSHGVGLSARITSSAITLPESWALYLFVAWAIVAAWCLARVVMGLWHVHTLRKSCVAIDAAKLDARLLETVKRNQGRRVVSLCTSERVQVPTAIGLLEPAVVIPQWAIAELSADELNQIVLHELAHLRRWDDWTNLAQKIMKALFFFHPAVWWIETRVSLEREMACDDAVLAETARPRAYAECLTHLAEKALVRRGLALAQAALGRVRHTSMRVAQILDVNRPRVTKTKQMWRTAVPVMAGLAIVCGLVVTEEPHLVAFQDAEMNVSTPASASLSAPAIKPTLAAFKTADPQTKKIALQPRPARALRAKNKSAKPIPAVRNVEEFESAFLVEDPFAESGLVHFTGSTMSPVVSTQAVYLLVEHPQAGPFGEPVYQIQMWRVTVLHPAAHSASKEFPRKQT
jgi:beta-lactamase regulating signal transducer with metallopeptidase domain